MLGSSLAYNWSNLPFFQPSQSSLNWDGGHSPPDKNSFHLEMRGGLGESGHLRGIVIPGQIAFMEFVIQVRTRTKTRVELSSLHPMPEV